MTKLGSNSAQLVSQGRYARLMGNLWRHPKTAEVGDAALGLLMRLLSYCADQGVDRVSETLMVDLFRRNPNGRRQLNQLLAVGFVDKLPEGGYAPHDWYEHNRVTKPVKLKLVRDEPVRKMGGLCDDDVMTTPPETIQEKPSSRARAKTQDPRPKSFNSPSESLGDAEAPPPPAVDTEPPKLREVRAKVAALEARYEDPELVAEVRQGCANTRKGGRLADTVWLATLLRLAAVERSAVLAAFHEYVERYADGDRGEGYLVAVAKGKAKRGDGLRKAGPPRAKEYVASEETGNAEEVIALLQSRTRAAS